MTVMLRQIDPPPPAQESRHCGNCGYDLRGAVEARCPECGVAFDPSAPPMANVPWFHRRNIGRGVALWRTMWLVMLRPRRFADAVLLREARLDVDAARRFRWICVVVAGVSTSIPAALEKGSAASATSAFLGTLPAMLLFFALTAVLVGVSDFESVSRAARFRTLNEFSNAPLLLMPLVALTFALCRAAGQPPNGPAALLLVSIVAVWIVYKFLYQAWAAGRGFVWLLTHLGLATLVWGIFALLCLALIAYTVAFTNRLFDW
jgi:hypothetical protein